MPCVPHELSKKDNSSRQKGYHKDREPTFGQAIHTQHDQEETERDEEEPHHVKRAPRQLRRLPQADNSCDERGYKKWDREREHRPPPKRL